MNNLVTFPPDLPPKTGQFSTGLNRALASSPLESDLRALGIRSVVVTGVLTPFCVAQTARELADRDFDVAIVQDATASLTETAHTAALAAFEAIYGSVVPTREVVQAMGR